MTARRWVRRRRWENYWPTKASRGARVCMAITAAGASIALTQRHSTTREPARAGREVTTDRASTLSAYTHTYTYTHLHILIYTHAHVYCIRVYTLYRHTHTHNHNTDDTRVFPRHGAPFKKTWSISAAEAATGGGRDVISLANCIINSFFFSRIPLLLS